MPYPFAVVFDDPHLFVTMDHDRFISQLRAGAFLPRPALWLSTYDGKSTMIYIPSGGSSELSWSWDAIWLRQRGMRRSENQACFRAG
jgi:hypothetical protein